MSEAVKPTLPGIFLAFAKVGAMTFGGGYAMIPILERELIDKRGWATNEELMDYYAVGQCTPGIIAVNTATFIGNKLLGTIGGIIATLGMVFPSLVIITVIAGVAGSGKSSLMEHFMQHTNDPFVFIGQKDIGINLRSTPATYLDIADTIRRLFVKESLLNGQRPPKPSIQLFSFNSLGACPACKGKGIIVSDRHPLQPRSPAIPLPWKDHCRGLGSHRRRSHPLLQRAIVPSTTTHAAKSRPWLSTPQPKYEHLEWRRTPTG